MSSYSPQSSIAGRRRGRGGRATSARPPLLPTISINDKKAHGRSSATFERESDHFSFNTADFPALGSNISRRGRTSMSASSTKDQLQVSHSPYASGKSSPVRHHNDAEWSEVVYEGNLARIEEFLYSSSINIDAYLIRPYQKGSPKLGALPLAETPLQAAAREGRTEVVNLLLRKKANIRGNGGAVIQAAAGGHWGLVRSLCKYGADASSALYKAANDGNCNAVNILLDCGADINAKGQLITSKDLGPRSRRDSSASNLSITSELTSLTRPTTALHAAAYNNHIAVVQFLLKHGAKLTDRFGRFGDACNAAHAGMADRGQPRKIAAQSHMIRLLGLWTIGFEEREFTNLNALITHIRDPSLLPRTSYFSCEIPRFHYSDANSLEPSFENLGNVVVIVSNKNDPEAVTCADFVSREWGSIGSQLLEGLGQLKGAEEKAVLEVNKYQINAEITRLPSQACDQVALSFGPDFPTAIHGTVLKIMAWICEAIRAPLQKGLVSSSSICQIIRVQIADTDGSETATASATKQTYGLKLFFSLAEPKTTMEFGPSLPTGGNCWQLLLDTAIISSRCPRTRPPGFKGLEVSLELMIEMAAIDAVVQVDEGVVLIGYRTALIPIKSKGNCIQFHLEVSACGPINPYELECLREDSGQFIMYEKNVRNFKNMRCFVGWCNSAMINLGTNKLPDNREYSRARGKQKVIVWDGISVTAQAVSAAPLQAGAAFGMTGRFKPTQLRFPRSESYTQTLKDMANHTALVIDAEEKRSWLVPKLSLVLHMCHMWLRDGIASESLHSFDENAIPLIEPHWSGSAISQLLEGKGDNRICGQGSDTILLRHLLLGININLQNSKANTEKPSGNVLYGYEIMAMIQQPEAGGEIKQIRVTTQGKSWLPLIQHVDAVAVGSNLGSIITATPVKSRVCERCNVMPIGLHLMAAAMGPWTVIAHRKSVKEENLHTEVLQLGEGHFHDQFWVRAWQLSGRPFEPCVHDAGCGESCWSQEHRFQQIANRVVWSRLQTNQQVQSQLKALPKRGALVFGHKADDRSSGHWENAQVVPTLAPIRHVTSAA